MKAYEWIDRVKVSKKITSDYAVAKSLGVTQAAVSKLRARNDATLSDETAVKVAQLLGLNPAGVLVDQLAERAKSPEVRSTLSREVERLCILC